MYREAPKNERRKQGKTRVSECGRGFFPPSVNEIRINAVRLHFPVQKPASNVHLRFALRCFLNEIFNNHDEYFVVMHL